MSALQQRACDLSVIIPVYNLEDYITPMLLTLLKQDLGIYKVEYIFVLNNCKDDSEGVIRASGLECRILNCTEQGCGPARNVGFDAARGTYIWFMDGDDWLTSDAAIKTVLDFAYANDLDIVRIPFTTNTFWGQYFSMVWQYVFKREFVVEFKFPSIQPAEDDRYMEEVLHKAGYNRWSHLRLPYVPEPLYFYNYGREGSNMWRVARGEKI